MQSSARYKLDSINNLSPLTTISSLKTLIEQDIGILREMYTLTYLDTCPLLDHTTLQQNFVVNGGTMALRPWRMWEDLLSRSYSGHLELCMSVTCSSEWNKYCAWVALYIASHRGHHLLVATLLNETGAQINLKSSCGWTPLHAAARTGQWKVLCILLDKGADVRLKDNRTLTAFDLARKHGHKKCENSLNFCQWNLQKHYIVQERRKEYDPNNSRRTAERQSHLAHDSTLTTWLYGKQGQLYMTQLNNTVPVRKVKLYNKLQSTIPKKGTSSISSFQTNSTGKLSIQNEADYQRNDCQGAKFDFDYGWFDKLRAQQLIPPTHDIITYADPSSYSLRPRSLLNSKGFTIPLVNTSKVGSKSKCFYKESKSSVHPVKN